MYSIIGVDSVSTRPSSTSVGMEPSGLILRYSGRCCSSLSRSTYWLRYGTPFSARASMGLPEFAFGSQW
jgi:hypothetical protein